MGYGEPTEIYKQLKARQVRAEADPLEVGVNLAWSGSSLKEDVTPPSDYPHHQSNSPNPPRAFHSTLLDPVEGVSSRPWSLTLIEPLKVGTWRFSQVWRVEATQVEQPGVRFPLVVKIYQESLFPIPEDEADRDSRGWHLPPTLIENESNAYRLARGSQGTDIPLCYGFYRFQLHSREEAVGVVLEDLVANREGITVDKFLEREAKAERLTLHAMDRIMCAALELQDRLLESGLASILHFLDQFVILRSSDPYTSEPTLIGFGFSDSSTRERIHARFEAGELEIPRWRWRWKKPYQNCLFGALPGVVTSVSKKYETLAFRWGKLEKKRKRLEFLCLHEVIPEPPEAAEQAELEQQEQDRKDREELHLMLGGHLSDL